MVSKISKPRMVYFQWDHNGLPEFLKLHMQLHLKCLSEFFEVTLINYDCNYKQICDTYNPDIALFESGFKSYISKKPLITEVKSYNEVPKVGLHNGDPWCNCRVGFLADMERWDVETFFTIGTTMSEYTPGLSDNLFYWPNFIDSDVFYDYGQIKSIPILFNGMRNSLYPWRNKIYDITVKEYPSITSPHTGYDRKSKGMVYGEKYAQTINASLFVPTCGTLAKEVVRKHFEIPGAHSCLVTEKSTSLEAAGFIDMENCVFADETDVLDKLNFLLNNREELGRITSEGHALIHSQHTYKQRNQIFQWYELNKKLGSNEKIIQKNPFGALSFILDTNPLETLHIHSEGLVVKLIQDGDKALWAGNFDEAESNFLKCLEYIAYMSEPKLKLAICYLFKGKAKFGLDWVLNPIQQHLGYYSGADCPDPIEWAYLIIALLCNGKTSEAFFRANQYPELIHPELDRARLIISFLLNINLRPNLILDTADLKPNQSIHQIPNLDFQVWLTNVSSMFRECKQYKYAGKLSAILKKGNVHEKDLIVRNGKNLRFRTIFLNARISIIQKVNTLFNTWNFPQRKSGLPAINFMDFGIRIGKWAKIDRLRTKVFRIGFTN